MTTFPIPISFPSIARPVNPTGIWGWLTTIDHKRIGILYGVTAFILFLSGGIEATLMRLQLAGPELDIVSAEVYNQLFTMHGTTMIFLAIMPMGAAFFNFIIPLQIGARDVAFPRLNAFSYWTFLAGALMLKLSWIGGATNAGWFGYAPLTSISQNPGTGIDFWIISLQVLGIASLAAAFNFIVTIINMRAPGMHMMRLPVFIWMSFITAILLVLAFPVITVALIELTFDRYFAFNFFNVSNGGSVVLWQHLFWVFGHPEVYILILPAMGIVSEVLPVFSKKPLFGYATIVLAGAIIAFMGWMVWSHHMFTVGMGPAVNAIFTITTMLIAVPTGIKVFNWLATIWGGSIKLNTPMLFSLGFIAMFLIGGISGVMHAVSASDAQQQDTYFIPAHIHYVLFGGAIMALMSGIYYWYPKITGKMYDEKLGKFHFWTLMVGQNLTFFPMHFVGLEGMPRRIYTYAEGMGWDLWNGVSTFGVFIIILSFLAFILNFVKSWKSGEIAPADPWDGRTLEWSIPSPAPEYNFKEIPQVKALDDWWVTKQENPDIEVEEPVKHHNIHLPQPSYWPLITSLGIFIAGYGVVFNGLIFPYLIAAIGTAITFIGVYAWSLEPVNDPDEHSAH
ncbi:MAG: cytochrome c oxidase subunit I [SAR202 cluster bacterium]|nr:cytochrome c oxidase subunit I [Chloroflexota bacterium]MQG22456.1 cytochrome c oxidase subunit I [SAR202 cluster bacterium]|tara:strand:+ start:6835 stop:8694 length:1860 start_codon:yes stop_codon:yes gene_type:complete